MRKRKFPKKKTSTKWGRQAYIDNKGKVKLIHQRVVEKKYKLKEIPKGFIVHHIDENKDNNKPSNLILIHKKDHYRLHVTKTLDIKNKSKKK